MAKIIYDPASEHHDCSRELAILDAGHPRPVIGSVAECSCGRRWRKTENQWDGTYWTRLKQGGNLR